MVTNASEFLTNPCDFLMKPTISLPTFRVNPLRMLRLLTNVLRSLQMPCHQKEYIAMLTKTLRICFPSEF